MHYYEIFSRVKNYYEQNKKFLKMNNANLNGDTVRLNISYMEPNELDLANRVNVYFVMKTKNGLVCYEDQSRVIMKVDRYKRYIAFDAGELKFLDTLGCDIIDIQSEKTGQHITDWFREDN